MANGALQRFIGAMGTLLKSEKLDELPETQVGGSRQSLLSWLVQAESLPLEEEAKEKGSSFASRLFATEALPLDERPERRDAHASFLVTLFSRERLPTGPVPGHAPGSRPSGLKGRSPDS